jgi:hypothetical protein
LIESVASGIPRLDYYTSGGTAGCPALLVEPAGTNLCLQSEAFNTTWTRVSGGTGLLPVITANAVVAPDGTTTADTVVFDRGSATSGTANFSQLEQVINFPTSGTYTFGVYAKATASGDVGKQFYIRTRNTLVSGSLTSSWVRYTSTETGLTSGNNPVYIGNRGGYTANQSVSVDLWGAQLETGSVATSYIPTTAASGSRSADVVSVSGAVSGSIGQTEGTMYAEFEATNDATTRRLLTLSDGSQLNRIMLLYLNGEWRAQIQATNILLGNLTSGYHKIAFAYQQNGVSGNLFASIDGGAVVSGTSATFPASLTMVNLGKIEDTGSSSFLNARIRAAALYTTRLTDAELATLTTP